MFSDSTRGLRSESDLFCKRNVKVTYFVSGIFFFF